MSTTVTYTPYGGSATILNPPPFVSQSRQPIDAGALRLGQIEEYELDGVSSRDIALLSNIFSKSPGRLVVNSNNSIILEKDDLYVTSFSIPQNDNNAKAITTLGLSAGSAAIPYKVKFKRIVSLSGIKDPSFEYNFTQNEDKSVNLNMKAAAVGIHSISSAQVFVDGLLPNTFTPSAFAPIYIRTATAWSLLSNKKTVDRSKFSYSIERSYRCNPSGYISVPNFPFTETTTVSNQSNVNEDYETYQFESNLKLHNPTNWNAENLFTSQNYIENISKHYLKRYDATNSDALFNNTFLDNVSVSKNQEAGEVNLKWQLLVGAPDHFKGYFDYSVSIDEDLSLGENSVSLDGSFISKGDLTNRKEYLSKWLDGTYTPPGAPPGVTATTASQNITKSNNAPNYNLLARNLLTAGTHSMTAGVHLNLNSIQVSVDQNADMADFKLSCSANNSTDPFLGAKINFNADVQQSIPIRKFSQSANIEGHYILQDFNCNSLEKASLKVNVDADSAHFNNGTLKPIAIAIMGHMFNSFVKKGNAAPVLSNYINLVPENLQISSEPGGGLAINYDLMYAANKTCNYNVITSGPMNAAAATVAVPDSKRSTYFFGR